MVVNQVIVQLTLPETGASWTELDAANQETLEEILEASEQKQGSKSYLTQVPNRHS